MKVNIAEIKIGSDKIEVGMNIQNNNQHAMTWYPDQEATIVVGDMQLDSNMFMGSGKLGGDIEAGVKKDGVLVFPVAEGKTLDVAKVANLKLKVGEAMFFGAIDEAVNGSTEISNLAIGALVFSIVAIVGSIVVKFKPKFGGLLLLIAAIGGLISISMFFLLPFVLLLIAGLMGLIRKNKQIESKIQA